MGEQLVLLKESVYATLIKYPAKTDVQIALETGVSRGYVWQLRQKFIRKLDWALAQNVAGAFLAEFQMASDAFKLQINKLEDKIKELEELKKGKKTIFKKGADGQTYPEDVELNSMDKLLFDREIRDTMKQQHELWKSIVHLARQGEAVEVMKMLQDGRIIQPTTN